MIISAFSAYLLVDAVYLSRIAADTRQAAMHHAMLMHLPRCRRALFTPSDFQEAAAGCLLVSGDWRSIRSRRLAAMGRFPIWRHGRVCIRLIPSADHAAHRQVIEPPVAPTPQGSMRHAKFRLRRLAGHHMPAITRPSPQYAKDKLLRSSIRGAGAAISIADDYQPSMLSGYFDAAMMPPFRPIHAIAA